MSIQFINDFTKAGQSLTSLQITGLSLTAGNIIFVLVTCLPTGTTVSTISDDQGGVYTKVKASNAANADVELWTTPVAATPQTQVTVNFGATANEAIIAVIQAGPQVTGGVTGIQGGATATQSNTTNPSLATSTLHPNDYVLTLFGFPPNGNPNLSSPNQGNLRVQVGDGTNALDMDVVDNSSPNVGSLTSSVTLSIATSTNQVSLLAFSYSIEWLGQGDVAGDWMDNDGIYWGSATPSDNVGITAPITGHADSGYTGGILALLDSGNVLVITQGPYQTVFGNLIQTGPRVKV